MEMDGVNGAREKGGREKANGIWYIIFSSSCSPHFD